MKIELLSHEVMYALTSRGHSPEEIEAMTPNYAFVEYCEWNSFRQWGYSFINTLDMLRSADVNSAENQAILVLTELVDSSNNVSYPDNWDNVTAMIRYNTACNNADTLVNKYKEEKK